MNSNREDPLTANELEERRASAERIESKERWRTGLLATTFVANLAALVVDVAERIDINHQMQALSNRIIEMREVDTRELAAQEVDRLFGDHSLRRGQEERGGVSELGLYEAEASFATVGPAASVVIPGHPDPTTNLELTPEERAIQPPDGPEPRSSDTLVRSDDDSSRAWDELTTLVPDEVKVDLEALRDRSDKLEEHTAELREHIDAVNEAFKREDPDQVELKELVHRQKLDRDRLESKRNEFAADRSEQLAADERPAYDAKAAELTALALRDLDAKHADERAALTARQARQREQPENERGR